MKPEKLRPVIQKAVPVDVFLVPSFRRLAGQLIYDGNKHVPLRLYLEGKTGQRSALSDQQSQKKRGRTPAPELEIVGFQPRQVPG